MSAVCFALLFRFPSQLFLQKVKEKHSLGLLWSSVRLCPLLCSCLVETQRNRFFFVFVILTKSHILKNLNSVFLLMKHLEASNVKTDCFLKSRGNVGSKKVIKYCNDK